LEKLYKTQISAHKGNNIARCRKGKAIARDLRLQNLKRTVSEAKSLFNPLTPELNPSEQPCLLEFFTGDFKFYCLILKKSYLISFSFKFNEIYFCILLMNWAIHTIFKPVNRMHYIECGVNGSLLT